MRVILKTYLGNYLTVTCMDVKKAIVLVTVIAVMVAVGSGYVMSAYAQESNNNATTNTNSATPRMPWMPFEHKKFEKGLRGGLRIPVIEVSPEYNSTVINVLRSNTETSQLLDRGFSVKAINPLIRAYVGANGEVTLKATQAVVVLTNGTVAYTYLVDISNNAVTLISYHLVKTPGYECVCKSANQ